MAEKPKPTELSKAANISVPYASQILSDEVERMRTPSRALAIHIFRKTGWRHESIAELTDDQISFLEEIEPWGRAA